MAAVGGPGPMGRHSRDAEVRQISWWFGRAENCRYHCCQLREKCRGFLGKEGKFIASEEKDLNGMITNDVLKIFGPA